MKTTRKLTLCAMLLAVMLTLGYVESLFPVPGMPGVKLGLSNCVLVLAVYEGGAGPAFALMGAKVLLSGFLFGSPVSMLYALAGGACSLAAMLALKRLPGTSAVGVGMAGGAVHNAAQTGLAALLLHTPALLSYLALLLPVGAAAGFLTGTTERLLSSRLRFSFSQMGFSDKKQEKGTTKP